MYRCFKIVAVLCFSVVANGQATPPAQPATAPQTSAATPAPAAPSMVPNPKLPVPIPYATVPDNTRFLNAPSMLVFCTSQVASFNGRNADMIFIGDSITEAWLSKGKDVWMANWAPRNALDFGVSGDQIQNVLWRMEAYPIAQQHPKVAVILIGTNNQNNSPSEIAAGVRAVVDKTLAMYPGIKVIVNSIMPNKRNNDRMMAANVIIRTYADDKTIFYLDLVPLMTPVGDNWKGLGADHLHPDASGYQLWTDALLPLVNKLIPAPAGVPAAAPQP